MLLQIALGTKGCKELIQDRLTVSRTFDVLAGTACRRQQSRNVQQLTGVQHTAAVSAVEGFRHIFYTGKGGASLDADELPCRFRLILQTQHIAPLCGRTEIARTRLCRIAHRDLRQHVQHTGQLQLLHGFVKHIAHSLLQTLPKGGRYEYIL